uniref:Uncharacterized protein n=1 Tax=uncultured bacterium A1Q1_fos_493 TaxID=1256577 RepID=L7W1L2_9BACT|nr:hypothetical protein [uncultured bacterium A1Q1_fos_493]
MIVTKTSQNAYSVRPWSQVYRFYCAQTPSVDCHDNAFCLLAIFIGFAPLGITVD